MTSMTFQELKEQLEQMSPEQLKQEATAFVIGKYATKIELGYEEGDALIENGHPYFLVG